MMILTLMPYIHQCVSQLKNRKLKIRVELSGCAIILYRVARKHSKWQDRHSKRIVKNYVEWTYSVHKQPIKREGKKTQNKSSSCFHRMLSIQSPFAQCKWYCCWHTTLKLNPLQVKPRAVTFNTLQQVTEECSGHCSGQWDTKLSF